MADDLHNEPMIIEHIDRGSFEPAYVQLVNLLRSHIAAGLYGPGDRLPSEAELRKKYDVSPMTVRRAINILVDRGVVETVQGLGTFVKPLDLGSAAFRLDRFLLSDPARVRVRLLAARIDRADERTAAKLGLTPGDKTIFIRRLLLEDDEPAFYHRESLVYDPARPIVEAEMEVTSLQGVFSGSGGRIVKKGEVVVGATLMNEEESHHLGVPLPAAGLFLEHVFFDVEGRPISWGRFVCRGDRPGLSTRVGYVSKGDRPDIRRSTLAMKDAGRPRGK